MINTSGKIFMKQIYEKTVILYVECFLTAKASVVDASYITQLFKHLHKYTKCDQINK